jgi:NAD-dependent DNA ligase
LYELEKDDLVNLSTDGRVLGMLGEKIYDNIQASKQAPLAEFVGSLGVKFLGRREAVHMIEAGVDTYEKFMDLTVDQLLELPGFKQKKAEGIFDGIQAAKPKAAKLIEAGVVVIDPEPVEEGAEEVVQDGSLSGKSFCFTGKIEKVGEDGKRFTRKMMWEVTQQNGGIVAEKVVAGVSYLVQADPSSQSSKTKKAAKLGTEIISETQFFEMVGSEA